MRMASLTEETCITLVMSLVEGNGSTVIGLPAVGSPQKQSYQVSHMCSHVTNENFWLVPKLTIGLYYFLSTLSNWDGRTIDSTLCVTSHLFRTIFVYGWCSRSVRIHLHLFEPVLIIFNN
jgi:hypothetical protein